MEITTEQKYLLITTIKHLRNHNINVLAEELEEHFDEILKLKWWIIQSENKQDLIINRLLLIWKIMAECYIWTNLSEEYIKTHNELEQYHKKIIEEYENKIAPKFIKVDNMKEFINKKN